MTSQFSLVGRLGAGQVKSVLESTLLAPSTHNTQPWLFRCTPAGFELHADPERALPVVDPDQRELVMSCGAALFNLRAAVHALGFHPATTLLPRRGEPNLLARVNPLTARPVEARMARLAEAIPLRHTNRLPFTATAVPPSVLATLRSAAETEQAWMPSLDTGQRRALLELVRTAHDIQITNPAFREEWAQWTGRDRTTFDGVPTYPDGLAPTASDGWVLRDFAAEGGDTQSATPPAPEPMVIVIGSIHDERIDRLRAGQAMQRVLLTATAAGLHASFISQPVEVPHIRAELRQLLGGGLWPQIVLRVGYGTTVPPTPRRPLADVLLHDGD